MGHLGEVERREVGSTAAAAEMAGKDPHAAAIAGALAAEIYKVPIVAEHIEDSPDNMTRFFVVAEHSPSAPARTKPACCW